ncbi:MAG: hypothetical protein ACK4OE_01145 [Acidovorax sp.]|uniref:hypothetical protein n=1 Tax=Acidovorax sp. TaxID=1872122 RepID=UPI00391A2DE9
MNHRSSTSAPNDGDFASYVEGMQKSSDRGSQPLAEVSGNAGHSADPLNQSIEDILVRGEDPTDEFLEEWNEIHNAPELSDEELARQALSAPGDDGDPNTPE